jgi:hypothetical protein
MRYILVIFTIILVVSNAIGQEVPVIQYKESTFIDANRIFLNEGLNRPFQVREVPGSREKVVFDIGNIKFYIFSKDGNIIRKFGTKGQGPDDILRPKYFEIDKNGGIYTYDDNNKRISIYSLDGQFQDSFKINGNVWTRLFITDKNKIVTNLPKRGYYISVFASNGKVIREIGEIPKTGPDAYKNPSKSEGFAFKVDNGFYAFLETLHRVKIYDINGALIREKAYNTIFPHISTFKDWENKVKKQMSSSMNLANVNATYFWHIIYRNDLFYILSHENLKTISKTNKELTIFVINKNLELERILLLKLNNKILYSGKIFGTNQGLTFEISDNENSIYFPRMDCSEILLFNKN